MKFSIFFFSGDGESVSRDKYSLLLAASIFADRHGFAAVWTPERHFQRFGGLYPNPSLTSAAIAAVTKVIQVRAGSVVLPLQNLLRVAEEWSVVDNLSGGRVGVSFASGWHVNDFVLAADRYEDRKEIMFSEIETIRRLWRGESLELTNGMGIKVPTRILPRPIQGDLPVWITAQSEETFERAGALGYNVLTNYNYKSPESLRAKIARYREARSRHERAGSVAVMTHTFVGPGDAEAAQIAGPALRDYLISNLELHSEMAKGMGKTQEELRRDLSAEDIEFLLDRAIERVVNTVGLIGGPDACARKARDLFDLGADEIACLIDFGIDEPAVLASLERLHRIGLG